MDENKLHAFMGQVVGDMGGSVTMAMVQLGDEHGLYEAMDGQGPIDAATLAARTSCNARLVQE